jgi:hypothetical protein
MSLAELAFSKTKEEEEQEKQQAQEFVMKL